MVMLTIDFSMEAINEYSLQQRWMSGRQYDLIKCYESWVMSEVVSTRHSKGA